MQEIWEAVSAVASALTALAVSFAIMQLVTARKQRHLEFELVYIQRYRALIDELSFDIGSEVEIEVLNPRDRKLSLQYLRLCEDQLDVRKRKFVTDETWEIWREGIRLQIGRQPFLALMNPDIIGKLDWLPGLAPSPRVFDPLAMSTVKTRWYGLR
ncbi:hypothetical protein [Arthrobacter sp. E3]|uniref:hypothetical protein n=1 Tax=Arthrobacter sp. E3 TaxID=517402 RepID=UPI001A946EE4|nr:hypothetical protein [Arthrobacter sp. E3]